MVYGLNVCFKERRDVLAGVSHSSEAGPGWHVGVGPASSEVEPARGPSRLGLSGDCTIWWDRGYRRAEGWGLGNLTCLNMGSWACDWIWEACLALELGYFNMEMDIGLQLGQGHLGRMRREGSPRWGRVVGTGKGWCRCSCSKGLQESSLQGGLPAWSSSWAGASSQSSPWSSFEVLGPWADGGWKSEREVRKTGGTLEGKVEWRDYLST